MGHVQACEIDLALALSLYADLPPAPACERCGEVGLHVTKQPCRTAYAEAASNVSPMLCPACSEEYHDYWDNMWDEYNRGRG